MRVDVALTPAGAEPAATAVVVDVLRATSTIVQALDAGYERVLCCAEVEEALALRAELGEGVLGGERAGGPIAGFDLGNSPREYLEPRAAAVILTTTNGTRAIVAAAASAQRVLLGSLLNLEAVAAAAGAPGADVTVVCAGLEGRFALDDAYCAGRIVDLLDGTRTDAAEAAARLARSFASPEEGLAAARNPRREGLGEDVAWCARESVTRVVPVLVRLEGPAAWIEKAGSLAASAEA